tara:strand:+ start:5007 stop:5363 length:357 start_codon:yes stop_codon:yes gene_type:complete
MPRRRHRRRKIGGSLKTFWNKAKGFLKRTKLLSTIGSRLVPMAGSYAPLAGAALGMVKRAGYGRRRGGALRPAGMRRIRGRGCCGGANMPVGGRRRRTRRRMNRFSKPRLPRRMGPAF